ncbi:MAG: hypothetical protein JRI59_02720 [Deltaproteobacteria bacterium]|nr:hypothetical protein [Deltaproteobacteria bacterium]
MRFKSLTGLKRREPWEIVLATLPQDISITRFALDKAFKICKLVRELFQESFEWYGFTLAAREQPEVIIDIGLPRNEENVLEYARLTSEKIATYHEALPPDLVINGWIHSHGSLELRKFSAVDEANQRTVLDFVTSRLRRPLAKREVIVSDLVCLVAGHYQEADLEKGSVNLITDQPVREAKLLETVYGGFCYALVVGDEDWHYQEIYYQRRGILSGFSTVEHREAELRCLPSERTWSSADLQLLREEVQDKIQPITYKPEKLERV